MEKTDKQANALRYWLMGLNVQEVGKLVEVSPRTIERWMQENKWRELQAPKAIKQKAKELRDSGKSYAEISKLLGVAKSTVFNYLKAVEGKKTA